MSSNPRMKFRVKILTKILTSKFYHSIFTEQLFRDYEVKPELDRYENEGIDD